MASRSAFSISGICRFLRRQWVPALILAGAVQMASAAGYSGWSYYRTVTLTPNAAITAQTNYPLLVRITSNDALWANCNSNGYDIQFTASDGTTPISFQRTVWNYAGRNAEFWVLLPSVNGAGATTSFRMYWANSSATDASNAASVFSASNKYKAVWHLNAAQGANEADATGYATDQTATATGTPTTVAGPGGVASSVGKSFSSGAYYSVNNSGSGSNLDLPAGGPYTISCWINPSSTSITNVGLLGKTWLNGSVWTGTYAIAYRNGGATNLQAQEVYGGTASERALETEPAPGWHHLVMVRNGTADGGGNATTLAFYIDGIQPSDVSYMAFGTSPLEDHAQAFCIGKDGGSGTASFAGGAIAEVEVQNVVRDSSWIALSYMTQGPSYATYVTFGAPVSSSLTNPPILSMPASGSQNLQTTVNFAWGQVTGASAYKLQLSSTSSFSSTVVEVAPLAGASSSVSNLAYSTTYFWRVLATDNITTTPWSSVWSFATGIPLPVAPALSSPTNGASAQFTNVSLAWGTVSTATSYSVQVATTSTFSTPAFTQILAGTSWTPTGGFAGQTTYYWRVTAANATGNGPWAAGWSFTTAIAPPAAPGLASPVDGSANMAPNLTVSWGSSAAATSYTLQVSTAVNFGSTVINRNAQTVTSQPLSGLTLGATYYWRVGAVNAGGTTWSSTWSFAVSSTSVLHGAALAARAAEFSITGSKLVYSIPAQAAVRISFSDLLGRTVRSIERNQRQGRYVVNFKDCGLSAGHYMLRFRSAGIDRRCALTIAR